MAMNGLKVSGRPTPKGRSAGRRRVLSARLPRRCAEGTAPTTCRAPCRPYAQRARASPASQGLFLGTNWFAPPGARAFVEAMAGGKRQGGKAADADHHARLAAWGKPPTC